ncbi:MAG: hypothetical protein COY40_01680 [Alphaproteobacteria bacterium CG_4_10_14_0_8_um_filter_53_9]|nr:MAG: hypothetical protein COY40_01680 [Alphaproteobacteria bacterium CG_4_10_14_0_8_um_filter_53_9]
MVPFIPPSFWTSVLFVDLQENRLHHVRALAWFQALVACSKLEENAFRLIEFVDARGKFSAEIHIEIRKTLQPYGPDAIASSLEGMHKRVSDDLVPWYATYGRIRLASQVLCQPQPLPWAAYPHKDAFKAWLPGHAAYLLPTMGVVA